ncbi:MAG: hypothetical protein KJZ93_29375 [Caldilineaceae bacterium]|nr:hypothetical protein [Caldilineaceae bacterium]
MSEVVEMPVACSLHEAELIERRNTVLRTIGHNVQAVRELTDGYAFQFSSDDACLEQLMRVIQLERRCCPFLTFQLRVEPGIGSLWFEITGPSTAKDFIKILFD